MPPKRKAMAETSTNKQISATRNTKASKTSAKSTAPTSKPSAKASTKPKPQTFKYSDATTLSLKPKYLNLQWPNFADFIKDKNQDIPKKGELIDAWCDRVSDLGIPVSEEGAELLEKLDKEVEKRDQNRLDMHIYNDWNGWGMSEAFSNYLKDFNKDIFKKTVSPFKKWAYVEDETGTNRTADNEDGDSVKEIAAMVGLMVLTAYSALSEHSLFTPDSEVKNIGIMSLMMLEFAQVDGCDLDIGWGCEIVRMCDETGIDLDKVVRKQVSVSKKDLKGLRSAYKEKKDGYKKAAEIKGWKPENDIGGKYNEKQWFRWDWKLEYKEFKKNHGGGTYYDLTKWSKKDRERHTLGTKAFDEMLGIDSDSEDSDSTSE
ncbi:hypothetical protein L207DRAFT_536046 [Hyaloscypha variabilis F]|uniref:SAP domain-containing protein n=1 Tax=Hyaloscypha variabilis (strain UAMH 11265 / GT02V1 / F) TaxID=1149755 RepID=A0A2J6R2K5_HYAVF|nr:hypothetical protein L207DRAFT_536046 [Hyaloscypha variabilis F]